MVPAGRISMVDALRGWALLGLFLVHCVERFELYWLEPWNDDSLRFIFGLFGSKAYAVFALLFGFSFATIMGNERARGGDFTARFVWRLVLLIGFGTLHAVFYRGEILQVLGVIGLLLIPFDRVKSDRVLLAVAVLAFLELPLLVRMVAASAGQAWALAPVIYTQVGDLRVLSEGTFWQAARDNIGPGTLAKWSFYIEGGRVMQIVGLFLVGMVAQRRGWLANPEKHWRGWIAVLVAGLALAVFARGLAPLVAGLLPQPPDAPEPGAIGNLWAALGGTAIHVALFVLVWHSPLGRLLTWLAAPGRMTLTLYIGQSLVASFLLYGWGLGLWNDYSPTAMMLAGLVAFAAQALFARWWFGRFRYGPLEWLWRAGTLGTLAVPMKLTSQNRG